MRTCFVPLCDAKNKDISNRTMFLVPKEKTLFAQWAEVLPKVRTLKSTHKVCYLHFKPEDVIFTFDHCINGQIYKIQRDRPKLKPNALPCLKITTEEELISYRVKNRLPSNTKVTKINNDPKTDQVYDCIIEDHNTRENETEQNNAGAQSQELQEENCTIIFTLEDEEDNTTEQNLNNNWETQQTDLVMGETTNEPQETPELTNKSSSQDLTQTKIKKLFELLYDKAYEVLIPNTQWGIHRCANRSLLCFSFMDTSTLLVSKIISIYDNGSVHLFFNDILIKTLQLLKDIEDLDSLSILLNQVDEWRLCFGREKNAECEIVIESEDEICWSSDDNGKVLLCKVCLQINWNCANKRK